MNMAHPPGVVRIYYICVLVYAAAWALYLILPGDTQSQWRSYTPLKIEGSSSEVAMHFQPSGERSVISLDTAEVAFQEFSEQRRYTLRRIFSTYDPDDLRIDPFMQRMASIFVDEGHEWLFIPSELSKSWITQQMREYFPGRNWSFGTAWMARWSIIVASILCIVSVIFNWQIRAVAVPVFLVYWVVSFLLHVATVVLLALFLQSVMILVSRMYHNKSSVQKETFFKQGEIILLGLLFVSALLFITLQNRSEQAYFLVVYLATFSTVIFSVVFLYDTIQKRDHPIFVGHSLNTHPWKIFSNPRLYLFSLTALGAVAFAIMPLQGSSPPISPHGKQQGDSIVSTELFVQHSKYQEALAYGYTFEESKALSEIAIPMFSIDTSYAIQESYHTLLLDDHWEDALFANLGPRHVMQLLFREGTEGLFKDDSVYIASLFSMWIPIVYWICFIILFFMFSQSVSRSPTQLIRLLWAFRSQKLWKIEAK